MQRPALARAAGSMQAANGWRSRCGGSHGCGSSTVRTWGPQALARFHCPAAAAGSAGGGCDSAAAVGRHLPQPAAAAPQFSAALTITIRRLLGWAASWPGPRCRQQSYRRRFFSCGPGSLLTCPYLVYSEYSSLSAAQTAAKRLAFLFSMPCHVGGGRWGCGDLLRLLPSRLMYPAEPRQDLLEA